MGHRGNFPVRPGGRDIWEIDDPLLNEVANGVSDWNDPSKFYIIEKVIIRGKQSETGKEKANRHEQGLIGRTRLDQK